jgi:hypothetical protein
VWTVSAWARGTRVNGAAQLALAWFNAQGTYLGATSSAPLPKGNPGWTRLLARTRVPAQATSVQIFLKSSNVAGSVWFTDVGINVGPAYSGLPPATPAP